MTSDQLSLTRHSKRNKKTQSQTVILEPSGPPVTNRLISTQVITNNSPGRRLPITPDQQFDPVTSLFYKATRKETTSIQQTGNNTNTAVTTNEQTGSNNSTPGGNDGMGNPNSNSNPELTN